MMYWDGGWSAWTWFAMIFSMVVFSTVVGLVIWMLLRHPAERTAVPAPTPSAKEILRQRYAAGEIDEAEFERRMATLRDHSKPSVAASR